MRIGVFGFIALVLLAAFFPAEAQVYPSRDLRVVVGLPAGSGGDVTARFYADKLAQVSNKPVIVENRPGMILFDWRRCRREVGARWIHDIDHVG
jgi:tripartite-type tricarboxylate transporter receptor subunit TctC